MRGNAEAHALLAPASLGEVLALLAREPGQWTPIAGGTELMVAYAAGKLTLPRLVSLWGISDLRSIRTTSEMLVVGACTTFTDLRQSMPVEEEFPLLSKAASWIGAIANQSRATVGGNLVNGSPAADSSPALLVYDAELELVSVRGKRSIPYADFHVGYKQNALAPDELLSAIRLPRRFTRHRQYLRKVGTRRAMAIAKVALGATALLEDGELRDVRLAAASLAPFPARLYRTESVLTGRKVTEDLIRNARQALLSEAQPIDDIRSTADYRKQVGANLLEEFLRSLSENRPPA